jgi:hypothetical protein
MPNALALDGREIAVILPGSAWLGILTSHVEWAVTATPEEIAGHDRHRVARQLRLLLAAASDGCSPLDDDLLTEAREMVDATCASLGYAADAEDAKLAAHLVIRHDTLRSLITKLARAALPRMGRPPEPRTP